MFEHSTMFHTRSTLIKDINYIVSRIIRLNSKLADLRRVHQHDRRSLPRDKTSAIRCTKCEGYGHKNYQCPNWNVKYMTLQELQDYIVYLKEVKRSVRQKLEVRREQQAKREREKAERTLKEMWEKARQEKNLKSEQQKKEFKERQEKELKERKEQELRDRKEQEQKEKEEKKQREREEVEMRVREDATLQEKERKENERQEKEGEEQRVKQVNESLLTPLTCMVEMKSLKGDCNTLNCCSHAHHDFTFSLGKLTNPSLFVLMPREDLYIKEQWHKQWGEEEIIEKEETRVDKYETIVETMLVCLSCSEHIPRLFLSSDGL